MKSFQEKFQGAVAINIVSYFFHVDALCTATFFPQSTSELKSYEILNIGVSV